MRFFFNKTCADTQQVLLVQTGLFRYDKGMVQEINDEKALLYKRNLT